MGTGGGALWGRAELQTLPRTGVLVFICRIHCDFFPVRFGLNEGSAAAYKRFKLSDPALAFAVLIKKVDSGEGPTQPLRLMPEESREDSALLKSPPPPG